MDIVIRPMWIDGVLHKIAPSSQPLLKALKLQVRREVAAFRIVYRRH